MQPRLWVHLFCLGLACSVGNAQAPAPRRPMTPPKGVVAQPGQPTNQQRVNRPASQTPAPAVVPPVDPTTAAAAIANEAINPLNEWGQPPAGWNVGAPRPELEPKFGFEQTLSAKQTDVFSVITDERLGQAGFWTKTQPVIGGKHYRFSSLVQWANVPYPRRSVVVKIFWRDDDGKPVLLDEPATNVSFRRGKVAQAEPEYPGFGAVTDDGWTEIAGMYPAPSKATKAIIELHLQWAPNAYVRFSNVSFTPTYEPAPRNVRLATVHYQPKGGKSPMQNCVEYEPMIVKAAQERADLVVLGECITYVGLKLRYDEVAEPIPGPSTDYFSQLAAKYNMYIVPGLVERDGDLVFNTAVLIGPEGIVGKYRKVSLPRGEVASGITPGEEYPVFNTRFGKVGMMICYDGFFPEVARQLAINGAEIIAFPVWGCNPLLARARACENHVYVVSSTYTAAEENWMQSAVYDHAGEAIATAKEWGDVSVVEVDLNKKTKWPSLGDFQAEWMRARPVQLGEPIAR